MNKPFCSHCGARVEMRIPEGDQLPRRVCPACGVVHYENPRIVVGCVPELDGRILICLRAIEPRRGYWTVPAGFMENGETLEAGAARECQEEALAEVEIGPLLALVNIPEAAPFRPRRAGRALCHRHWRFSSPLGRWRSAGLRLPRRRPVITLLYRESAGGTSSPRSRAHGGKSSGSGRAGPPSSSCRPVFGRRRPRPRPRCRSRLLNARARPRFATRSACRAAPRSSRGRRCASSGRRSA